MVGNKFLSTVPISKKSQWLGVAMLLLAVVLTPALVNAYETYLGVSASDNYRALDYTYESPSRSMFADSASRDYEQRTGSYGGQYYAKASGSFDLMTGKLAFYVEAYGYDASASATVYMIDRIFPRWLSGKDDPMNISLIFDVTGDYHITGSSLKNWSAGALFGWSLDTMFTYWQPPWDQFNLTDDKEHREANLYFDPKINNSIYIGEAIGASLDPFNNQLAVADFSSTGVIQVILPEGAVFTSESGVFLSPAHVPLPGAFWLLAPGLLGLACRRRHSLKNKVV